MDATIPVNDPMSTNSISATPATVEKRPLDVVNLDSDSEPSIHNHPSSSMMVESGSKTTFVGSSQKAHKTSISSTAHSSFSISSTSGLVKPLSAISKSFVSQSGQSGQSSSSFTLSKNIKAKTVKNLDNTIAMMKDSLSVTPEDPCSKLHHEATAIIMKDMYLSLKKCMHIHSHAYTKQYKLMMSMIDASIDNNGEETNTLY